MYFCNGTAWTDMTVGGFTIPYSGTGNVTAPNILFGITNSANGRAIAGETSSPTYGVGVYGASTNTTPSSSSPSTVGVFGINNSQNSNGIGVYGQHDGTGEGVYGVVKNSGIGVYGIGLSAANGGNGFGVGVKGESTNSTGVYGVSSAGTALRGESNTGNGSSSTSTSRVGAYVESSSSGWPALYVQKYGTWPNAAEFYGSVTISDNLKVSDNLTVNSEILVDGDKGIVRSSSSTQQKVVRVTGSLSANGLGIGGFIDSGNLNYQNFGGIPTVTVGQINNTTATGEWYKVLIIPINVTTTECQLRIVNLASDSVTFSGTWSFLIVGPE